MYFWYYGHKLSKNENKMFAFGCFLAWLCSFNIKSTEMLIKVQTYYFVHISDQSVKSHNIYT